MASDESSIMLKTPADWDAWNKQFKAQAIQNEIYDQVQGIKPFLTAPQLPKPKDFATQVQTRSSRGQTTTQEGEVSYADLTEDGKSNIQFAFTLYKAEKDIYNAERESRQKLQN